MVLLIIIATSYILGRHTADNIRLGYEKVMRDFELSEKVNVVISDNASNMAKAFSVKFPVEEQCDGLMVDNDDLWVSNFNISVSGGQYQNVYMVYRNPP